jgi:hypothetical protein
LFNLLAGVKSYLIAGEILMVAYNFKDIHTKRILSGEKFATIRPTRRCKPGDRLQLYTGMRTRKAKLLKLAECVSIEPIIIHRERIDGIEMEIDEFLSMEGFEGKSFEDFAYFFDKQYGLPFRGYLIIWKDIKISQE